MSMSSSLGGGPTSRPCQLILQQCLAVTLRKAGAKGPVSNDPGEFWMYDSGYLLFQSFLSSNSKCWWNKGLVTACRQLRYAGYVQSGVLLVGSRDACALELVRAAYARGVLKAPDGHVIHALGDIEDCIVTPCIQGQFTPLPEALCDVILELTTAGSDAGLESIRKSLSERFANIETPSHETVYDALAQLSAERKIYHTSKGYFIVTPERRRSRSHSNGRCPSNSSRSTPSHHTHGGVGSASYLHHHHDDSIDEECGAEARRRMLLSQDELLVIAHGDMATLRDGHVTHQCVQTSLRDVICGGSPSDKIIYPRSSKRRSASFPVAPRNGTSPDRRRSTSTGRGGAGGTALRLWGSARRLRRSASTRSLARDKHHCATMTSTDSSSGTESNGSPKKASLLSRLFRRSTKRNQPLGTFSAQFPPTEWFNSTAIHLHSVATQTSAAEIQQAQEYYNCTNSETTEIDVNSSARSATLPRSRANRHRRHLSNESNGLTASYIESRDQSPNPRRPSPIGIRSYNTNSLPRSPNHKARKSSKTSIESTPTGRVSSKNSLESANSRIQSKTNINDLKIIEPTNDRLPSTKHLIDSRNRNVKQQIQGSDSRNSIEYRSMRDTIERRQRYALENRSVRDAKSTLERRSQYSSSKSSSTSKERPRKVLDTPSTSFESNHESISSGLGKINGSLTNSDTAHSSAHDLENSVTSGPSSLESNKTSSSKSSGPASLASGPSSLESQKTVIPSPTHKSGDLSKDSSRSKLSSLASSKSSVAKSNSFTLQVTTNKNGVSVSNYSGEPSGNTTTTATINGSNTKIFVQNSPIRSVITFENGQGHENRDYVLINNDSEKYETKSVCSDEISDTPTALKEKTIKNVNNQNGYEPGILNNSNAALNDFESSTMNNSRKLSLQLPAKDSLNYKNVLKNLPAGSTLTNQTSSPGSPVINFRDFTKNTFASNPPSPTKSYDSFGGSIGNVYYEKNSPGELKIARHSLDHSKIYQNGFSLDASTNSVNKAQDKNTLGSEPNLSHNKLDREKTLTRENVDVYNFPSLSDLSFNFTSLAAQKILKGVSINSVDTLVELNMAANGSEKPNNCDVQHTDFGIV